MTIGPLELLILIPLLAAPIVLAVIFITGRMGGRPCPRCGKRVAKGRPDCQNCGFDFRTMEHPG